MRPFELAAKVHAAVPLFRDQRDAVSAYARHLSTGHVLAIDSVTLGLEAIEDLRDAQWTPAELSDQLLRAIFGTSAGSTCMPKVSPQPGAIVRELPWQEWERATAGLDQSQSNPPSGPAGG